MIKTFFSSQPVWPQQTLAIIRIVVGLLMVYHGKEIFEPALMNTYASWDTFKGSAYANTLVYLGKGAEFVAGIMLALGLLTRVGALVLIATMVYITFVLGHGKFWYEDQHPFMFVLMGILFLFMGGGTYSLDYLFFSKRKAIG